MTGTPEDVVELIESIVTVLADEPEAVNVTVEQQDAAYVFEIAVAPDDAGKIIGRQGRVIKAIRMLARAAGANIDGSVEVEVIG